MFNFSSETQRLLDVSRGVSLNHYKLLIDMVTKCPFKPLFRKHPGKKELHSCQKKNNCDENDEKNSKKKRINLETFVKIGNLLNGLVYFY